MLIDVRDELYHSRNLGVQRLRMVDCYGSDVREKSEYERVHSRSSALIGTDSAFGTDELVGPRDFVALGHVR